jgi:hypothetical protein
MAVERESLLKKLSLHLLSHQPWQSRAARHRHLQLRQVPQAEASLVHTSMPLELEVMLVMRVLLRGHRQVVRFGTRMRLCKVIMCLALVPETQEIHLQTETTVTRLDLAAGALVATQTTSKPTVVPEV